MKGRSRRIESEARFAQDPQNGFVDVFALTIVEDVEAWQGKLFGPTDSPYEGGEFEFTVNFPEEFPYAPPNVKFITKIYHCNVAEDGHVCTHCGEDWSPSLTVAKLLVLLQSLLSDPDFENPCVPTIAAQYVADRVAHDTTAAEWTEQYAAYHMLK